MQPSLNVQTSYSLLSSVITFDDYFLLANKKKWTKLAICDTNMYGAFEFYQRCKENNIIPVLGLKVELVYEDETLIFTFFAKNLEGYFALVKISSFLMTNIENKKTVFDILNFDLNNLKVVVNIYNYNNYYNFFKKLITIFNNEIYFGLTQNNDNNKFLLFLNEKKYQKVIWNNDTFYLIPDDFMAFKIIDTIKKQILFTENNIDDNYALNNSPVFDNIISLENFLNDIESFQLENNNFKENLLSFPTPYNLPADKFLLSLCQKKMKSLSLSDNEILNYQSRLYYELKIINAMGFNDYFLIVWDYVTFAKNNNIYVGPGRGSAAGSLVSYLLNITTVDPVANNLLFERFLNYERNGMPDIDIDFQDNKREIIVEYLFEKYGMEHVAHIVTFQTIGFKMAVRDLSRIFNISIEEADKISKAVPIEYNFNFSAAMSSSKILIMYQEKYPIIFSNLSKIIGLPRQTGTHAAGVILSNKPLTQIVPIKEGYNGIYQTQYSMNHLEKIGLLKMDILGLRTLTILHDIVDNIVKEGNKNFSLDNIPLYDEKTFMLLAKGETKGIFQLESVGMTKVLMDMKPNSLEDIIATSSLYRPGPQDNIPTYIARKLKQKEIIFPDDRLSDILAPTYGIIVYQEQVMLIAQKVANFSLAKADILRRAMGKKNHEIMETMYEEFIDQAVKNNYSNDQALAIWNLIDKFAAYGFNRSHAYAYSLIGYQMTYLKANYPSSFLASLLSNVIGDEIKTADYLGLAQHYHLQIISPNINNPISNYQTKKKIIMMPLLVIKQIGYNFYQNIVNDFNSNGEYLTIYNFFIRLWKKGLNKKTYEALCFSGSLDNFNLSRLTLFFNYQILANYATLFVDNEFNNIQNYLLFSTIALPELINYESNKLLELIKEEEFLGFYLSYHPVKLLREYYKLLEKTTTIEKLTDKQQKANILIKIVRVKKIIDKNKKSMIFIDGYDETGEINLTVFANIYENKENIFIKNNFILINITTQIYQNKLSGVVNKVKLLSLEGEKNDWNYSN